MPDLKDKTGMVFGKWTVIRRVASVKGYTMYECRCECGTLRVRLGQNLRRSKNTGCGCVSKFGNEPFKSLFNRLRDAKDKGGSLTYEQYLTFTTTNECHYCGVAILWKPHNDTRCGYKLDRKDNNLEHSLENCVVCCPRCNYGKSDKFTYQEWKAIGDLIRSWRE